MQEQGLFIFNDVSPGSAFFLPHGARVYNKLIEFMRSEYRKRGFDEVITPNVFNVSLWKTSGHYDNYKASCARGARTALTPGDRSAAQENMFIFEVEGQEFGMKPMNCPGHCMMFKSQLHSYRELPLRYADFGVLHRNELSGALSGLTRVRRFQQDDAHIFCRLDQVDRLPRVPHIPCLTAARVRRRSSQRSMARSTSSRPCTASEAHRARAECAWRSPGPRVCARAQVRL